MGGPARRTLRRRRGHHPGGIRRRQPPAGQFSGRQPDLDLAVRDHGQGHGQRSAAAEAASVVVPAGAERRRTRAWDRRRRARAAREAGAPRALPPCPGPAGGARAPRPGPLRARGDVGRRRRRAPGAAGGKRTRALAPGAGRVLEVHGRLRAGGGAGDGHAGDGTGHNGATMTTAKDDLPRWRDSAGDPGGLGARAADLVDVVRGVPPLAPEVLARIERRVLSQRPARPGQRAPLGLRLALLAVVVLASVATAKGTVMLWRRHLASVAPRPPISRRSVAPARHPVPAVAAIPAPAPAPPAAPIRPAPRRRRSAMVAPRAVAPPARTEAQLLAHSLSVLRQAHDAAGALSILDEYARAFPHGVLEAEAFSARLEAVLQLHDRPTALRLL